MGKMMNLHKKATCKLCQTYTNSLQTLYTLNLCSAFGLNSEELIYLWCEGFYFRKNSNSLSLLLNAFPHVENWEIDWKAELPLFWLSEEMKQKQTGHSASSSILESRHKDSNAFIAVAWNFHWNKISTSLAFPHILMMVLLLKTVASHWSR